MDAEAVSELTHDQYVTLRGYPKGETSRWHVNKVIRVGSGETVPTRGIVLQIESAEPHWLMIIVNDGEIQSAAASEDEPPSGTGMEEHVTSLDPDEIEILDVE